MTMSLRSERIHIRPNIDSVTRARHPGEKRLGMVWRPAALRHSFFFFFSFSPIRKRRKTKRRRKEREESR